MPLPFWDSNESGYEGPDYAENDWDTIFFNGEQWPGVITAECRTTMKIDVKEPSGGDGSVLIERGYRSGTIVITVKLWTPSQWKLFQELLPKVWRPPGKPWSTEDTKARTMKGIHVSSAPLGALKIYSILIKDVEGPLMAPEFGARIWRINAVQFFEGKGDVTRKAKGAGHTLTKNGQNIKNEVNTSKPPSKTDGLPVTPTSGASGSF